MGTSAALQRFAVPLLTALLVIPSQGRANVLGNDAQHFNATTNGLDFVTVHSSETLMPNILNLGFFMNYAVNTLPFLEVEANRQSKTRDSLLAADLNIGYGPTRNLDFGFSFPFIVKQIVNSSEDRGEFEKVGNTEIRANIKYRFFGTNEYGMAFVLSGNYNRLEDSPYQGEGGGPTVNYELVADTTIGGLALGINLGYRDRNPGEQIPEFAGKIAPLDDQYIYSGAVSYHFPSISSKIILEAFGSQPVENNETEIARKTSSAEALLGIKHDLTETTSLHVGAGTELDHAISTPDYRVYAGVNMTFGHVGKKKRPKLVKQRARRPAPIKQDDDIEVREEGGPGDEVFVLRDVNFLFDSDTKVLAGAKEEMRRLADRIKGTGYSRVIIEGHTDSMGSDEYNMDLAGRRANAIRSYLVNVHGMDGTKIEAVSYGETKPIASNANYQGRQLNRRVVFRVFY